MPRKKKTIIEEQLPDNVLTTGDGESIEFGDMPIDDLFTSFGEEPFLMKVYKVTPSGSSFVYSTTDKPDPATFESSIQDRCPTGGKFVIRFYKNNHIVEPSKHVEIEAKPVSNVPASSVNDVAQVQIRMMQENLSMFQNMIMAFIGRPNPITPAPTPMNELVTMMTALAALNGNKSSDVETLIKGIDLAKGLNGSASPDWKSELIHTAKEVLAPVAGVIAQHKLQQGAQQQMISNPQQITDGGSMNFLVKSALRSIKPKILSNTLDPALAVDWIIANAADATYQPFLSMALQGDINTVIQLDPDFANEPYRTWMVTVIDMLKGAYDTNKADNDGGTGDGTDTTGHEVISSGISTVPKAV